jgi:hypothetical protein
LGAGKENTPPMESLEEDIFLPGGFPEATSHNSLFETMQRRGSTFYAVAVFQFLCTFLVLYSLRPDFLLTKKEPLRRSDVSLPLTLAISLGVTFATYFYSC